MSIRCLIFGHKPWKDGEDASGKWLSFIDSKGNDMASVVVCERCGVFYAMPVPAKKQPAVWAAKVTA